jgi:hypothetical protein
LLNYPPHPITGARGYDAEMRPRFQFSMGNVLRSIAWAAGSCGAWAMFFDDAHRGEPAYPGAEYVVALGMIFFLVCAPFVAVAALFGRGRQAIAPAMVATIGIFFLMASAPFLFP